MHPLEIREARRRIQIEFTEWPTLKLSLVQARRLWNLPKGVWDVALAHLVDLGFLSYTGGLFLRRGLGRGSFAIRRNRTHPPQAV